MPIENLPVWTIRPNWSGGVLERLEWLTSVLMSRQAAEQRIKMRLSPRRSFEFDVLIQGPERTLFDISVSRVGAGRWHFPIWHDVYVLPQVIAAGNVVIPVKTAGRSFKVGSGVLFSGRSGLNYEVGSVVGISPTELTIETALTRTWQAGTRVYPLRVGRLTDQPQPTRVTDRVWTSPVRFQQDEPEDVAAMVLPEMYDGMYVLTHSPNETGDQTQEYERLLAQIDNATGRRSFVDTAGFPLTRQKNSWMLRGQSQHASFRALLYALSGRILPIWLPTFAADFDLLDGILAGDTTLRVKLCGFTSFGGPQVGKSDIRIELRDGSSLYARITGSAFDDEGNEILSLSDGLSQDVARQMVRRVSFMTIARLDQDQIEIAHETDETGVSLSTLAFRSTPENRSAFPWSSPPLPLADMTSGSCGLPCQGPTTKDYPLASTGPGLIPMSSPYLAGDEDFNEEIKQATLAMSVITEETYNTVHDSYVAYVATLDDAELLSATETQVASMFSNTVTLDYMAYYATLSREDRESSTVSFVMYSLYALYYPIEYDPIQLSNEWYYQKAINVPRSSDGSIAKFCVDPLCRPGTPYGSGCDTGFFKTASGGALGDWSTQFQGVYPEPKTDNMDACGNWYDVAKRLWDLDQVTDEGAETTGSGELRPISGGLPLRVGEDRGWVTGAGLICDPPYQIVQGWYHVFQMAFVTSVEPPEGLMHCYATNKNTGAVTGAFEFTPTVWSHGGLYYVFLRSIVSAFENNQDGGTLIDGNLCLDATAGGPWLAMPEDGGVHYIFTVYAGAIPEGGLPGEGGGGGGDGGGDGGGSSGDGGDAGSGSGGDPGGDGSGGDSGGGAP